MKASEVKKWPRNSIVRDHAKRRSMLRFLNSNMPKRHHDSRLGLIACLAWNEGYEAARLRFKPGESQ